MKIQELINEIFKKKLVVDEEGKEFKLNSNICLEEGEFIQKIVHNHLPKKSLEVGCAYGISSLYICSQLEKVDNPHHTIIDPFQKTDWNNIGVANLKKAGVNFFTLIEKPSEIALPALYANGEKYDFAFIDGWHTFDHTLIDFFYIDKMLNVGGIIIIDDINFPSINKLMRYILNYPSYVYEGHVKVEYSKKRNFFDSVIKSPIRLFSKIFPTKIKYEIFAGSIINSPKTLNLNSSMIALKKINSEERQWYWFKDF